MRRLVHFVLVDLCAGIVALALSCQLRLKQREASEDPWRRALELTRLGLGERMSGEGRAEGRVGGGDLCGHFRVEVCRPVSHDSLAVPTRIELSRWRNKGLEDEEADRT